MPAMVSMTLAPTSRLAFMASADWPRRRMVETGSLKAKPTSATSATVTRATRPVAGSSRERSTIERMTSRSFSSPSTRATQRRLPSFTSPALIEALAARRWRMTSVMVSP
jgi:hypothetical protein